jgi:aminoglycoside phosphotransferase (APT) family kinase protein
MPSPPYRLLAQGRAAQVYDLGDGTVLRRSRNRSYDTANEAEAMTLATRFGVPVPVIHHVAGPDLVMERVDGPTMMVDLLEASDRVREHAATLARLHRCLDAVPAPTCGARPASEGGPQRLLHGDLHPDNIILSARGPVLIDWTNATFGPSAQDVAQTWLVLACFGHPDPVNDERLAGQRAPMLRAFLALVDRGAALSALPAAAAARLRDPNTSGVERTRIQQLLASSANEPEGWF